MVQKHQLSWLKSGTWKIWLIPHVWLGGSAVPLCMSLWWGWGCVLTIQVHRIQHFFTGPWIMLLTQCTVCIFYVLDFYCHCYHTANVVLHLESVAMVPLLIMNGGSKNQLWKQKIKWRVLTSSQSHWPNEFDATPFDQNRPMFHVFEKLGLERSFWKLWHPNTLNKH